MTNTETIQHADGRVELKSEALREIETSPLYNEDLAPVPVEKRNWTTVERMFRTERGKRTPKER